MSDSDKSKDRIDPFSEYIRDRLVDKPTSPDTDCWDKIDARLPKKRAISPVLYGLAIAASIIVAVFILNITGSEDEYPVQNEMAIIETPGTDKVLPEEKPDISSTSKKSIVSRIEKTTIDSHEDKDHIISPGKKIENVIHEGKTIDTSVEEKVEDSSKNIENGLSKEKIEDTSDGTVVKNVSKEQPSVQRETDKQQYKGFENMLAYNTSSSKRKNDWHLSAGFGSVGGTGSFISFSKSDLVYEATPPDHVFDPNKKPEYQDSENGHLELPGSENSGNKDKDNPPISGIENEREDGSKPGYEGLDELNNHYNNKISDIRTSIPISFGITVRKNFNRTIGVETGLVYTLLSTDMTIIDGSRSEVTLQLHYLGVPASLIVNIFDKRRWNIYMSGGGMVEKGLVAVSRSKNYYVYKNSEITKNSSISGLQWSLNGGIGLSYGIYKDLNLFVEPGVSYYFDNDQPISKRTEDPFSFNLRLGLRYDF